MSKLLSTFNTNKSSKTSLTANKLSNSLIQKLKSLHVKNSTTSNAGLITTEFNLEPISDRMKSYRKGFAIRAMDKEEEFDQVISNGFGMHNNNNEFCYTLKISLTPNYIRTL